MNGKGKDVRHFKGWPETTIDEHNKTIMIRARYVSPGMWRLRRIVFGLIIIGGLFLIFSDLEGFVGGIEKEGIVVSGVILLVVLLFIWLFLGNVFRATAQIEFTPDLIRIKKHGAIRWGEFERGLPHGFGADIHDKAYDEQKSDVKYQRRTGQESPEIYRKTFQVYMDHVDGRVYIADVMDKKNATMFLSRLTGVNEFMDTFITRADAARVIRQYTDEKAVSHYDAPPDDDRPGY